jgi:2-amino-4-hydroxy-6-hydroxymethyldihydropteridine diphosphokinase
MNRAFLGFGGNLGHPLTQFRQARGQLAEHQQVEVISCSPIYQTPAIGGPDNQPDFLNAVVEVQTEMSAKNLLQLCRQIEDEAGRTREIHWGPRTLDIDLLLFSDLMMDTSQLTLPHPRLHQRHFVLLPLNDIDSSLHHPLLDSSVTELLEQLPPAQGITQIQGTW